MVCRAPPVPYTLLHLAPRPALNPSVLRLRPRTCELGYEGRVESVCEPADLGGSQAGAEGELVLAGAHHARKRAKGGVQRCDLSQE